jgi:polyisoprenoid-binding protein YceI
MKKLMLSLLLISFSILNVWAQNSENTFFRLDTLQSKILWKCDKHSGSIKLVDGGFVLQKDSIETGLFYIDMHSIKDLDMSTKEYGTAIMILDNTLKDEFFEDKKFPFSAFKLISIKQIENNRYQVSGDFTMHGITNCITFNAQITVENDELIMTSDSIVLDRTDWGVYRMSPQRPYSDEENGWTVPDKIEIKIEIITKREI